MTRLHIPLAQAGITFLLLTLLVTTSQAVVQLGVVKCMPFINFTAEFHDAHRSCWMKQDEERKAADSKETKGKEISYPKNVPVEDFEWDDGCVDHCIYQKLGILDKDGKLLGETNTKALFVKGKISNEAYERIISGWNECLELSKRIAEQKHFNNCKTVTHHRHCANRKLMEKIETTEVAC